MSVAAEAGALARDICAREAGDPGPALRAAGLLDGALPPGVRVEVALAYGGTALPAALAAAGDDPAAIAAAFCGAGWAAAGLGMAYARERVVFGRPLAKFQVQRHAFALVAARLEAALALARRVAAGEGGALASDDAAGGGALDRAAVVPLAADAAWAAAEAALQVHGGYGYTDDYPVSRWWREIAAARAGLDRPAYDDATLAV